MAFLHALNCHQQRTLGGENNKWITQNTRTHTHIKKHFLPITDHRHVDCISIRGQEWLVISQGSDSQNGTPRTLTRPADPAQLSKTVRDTRLRSSRDGCVWCLMYGWCLCYRLPGSKTITFLILNYFYIFCRFSLPVVSLFSSFIDR